ncbi:MAG: sodium ion-translocating decarboxylase subunit beta [Treponema sp.]|nr:sodium ion-translocating decarboxylase subunit beta [Treponema sp.]MCL2250528.1 sodium ion-translocating decarboxylase subunit beta [Treponema sp.]
MSLGESIIASLGILNLTMGQGIMIMLAMFFLYLSIVKKFEPLLLLPLAFGILLANLPIVGLDAYYFNPNKFKELQGDQLPGLMNFLYTGIRMVIYPPLIFLCIGTMTDFSPLIASPRSALIGLGGQLGIFVAMAVSFYVGNALAPFFPGFEGFTVKEAAAIGIIGSSDGPTSIFTATRLAPDLLPAIAIAAFSYMALVPFIQPPIMKLLTTPKERVIVMPEPKRVTQKQKILFPIVLALVVLLLVPAAGALVAMLCLGNLIRESGVADRYVRAFQNDFLSILTFLVALSIGSSATADRFLTPQTLIILTSGLLAFAFGTVGGVLVAKLLCATTGGKVNPLIGNSGVSAMPMAARISQRLGQFYNPNNHLLMHAMGPIVSSTIGSAVIAGIFISYFK